MIDLNVMFQVLFIYYYSHQRGKWKHIIDNKANNERVTELANRTDKNFDLIVNEEFQNRILISKKVEELENKQILQFKSFTEDLDKVIKPRLESYENSLNKANEYVNSLKNKIIIIYSEKTISRLSVFER